ncbi:MAG: hypothetical protein GVY32_05570 [Gammaproteobacteria bacterium]|jgi:ABC-type uncharacterized transport system auxiliary subunit|nr:hypothetical protein [Gammaproteobacteria bacterium]
MSSSKIQRTATLLALAALSTACALGGGDVRYRVIAPQVTVEVDTSPSRAVVLAIGRPEADRTRDSSRILVRRGRHLLPWREAAWTDRAPDLLQSLAVESLDGRLATVVRRGSLPADYRLDLDLRRFELVEAHGGLVPEFSMGVRLLDASGRMLGATTISASGNPAAGRSLDAAMSAMEAAISNGLGLLAEWLGARLSRESGHE